MMKPVDRNTVDVVKKKGAHAQRDECARLGCQPRSGKITGQGPHELLIRRRPTPYEQVRWANGRISESEERSAKGDDH